MPRPFAPPAAVLAVAAVATVAGCARGEPEPEPAHRPDVELRAAAAATTLPLRVAPDLVVRRASFGVLDVAADGTETFVATDAVPAVDGTVFGWVVEVETGRETLRWQEHLRLPAAPTDWGDAEDDPDVLIAADGRSVAAQGEDAVDAGELARFYWTLAPGDPGGTYELDVAIEGRQVAHFTFRVPARVEEKAILVRADGAPPGAARLVAARLDAGAPRWK